MRHVQVGAHRDCGGADPLGLRRAAAEAGVTRENLIQRTATVESIDQASRLVTLRGEDGMASPSR